MKNKNHGNNQSDEDKAIEYIMLAVRIVVVISILIAIATWFIK
jgi:hypothetical protein